MIAVIWLCALATFFWFVMFSPWTAPHLNFWLVMAMATAVLAGSGLWLQRRRLDEIYSFKPVYVVIGIASAVLLYAIFGSAMPSRHSSSISQGRRLPVSTARARRHRRSLSDFCCFSGWGLPRKSSGAGSFRSVSTGGMARWRIHRCLDRLCRYPRLRLQLHALHGLPDLRAFLGCHVCPLPVRVARPHLARGVGCDDFCRDSRAIVE